MRRRDGRTLTAGSEDAHSDENARHRRGEKHAAARTGGKNPRMGIGPRKESGTRAAGEKESGDGNGGSPQQRPRRDRPRETPPSADPEREDGGERKQADRRRCLGRSARAIRP